MGRPTTAGPAVAVNTGGKTAAWCGGVFTGDPDITATARTAAHNRTWVNVWGHLIEAGQDTPTAALTALHAHNPELTIIATAPPEVTQILSPGHEPHNQAGAPKGNPPHVPFAA